MPPYSFCVLLKISFEAFILIEVIYTPDISKGLGNIRVLH